MSKILNPVQIVASALAMRPAPAEPAASVAADSDEPPERRAAKPRTRLPRQPLKKP
ncbi:hypothetical protein [Pseudomonas sp. NPDC007930]|uniref:hypothetical protein n=1 Tax=Pseudomonas sp. NPDC007930 TaxID=3364417 RepID=UPI0036E3A7C3